MLEDKLLDDYKQALKSKDNIKSSTLSFLRAQVMNAAIAKNKDKLDDEEVVSVIKKQVKSCKESIEQFVKGNRQDLADKELKELEVLQGYLPEEVCEDTLRQLVIEAVKQTQASTIKDMGAVIKAVIAKAGPGADGKLVSSLVKEILLKAA